MKKILVFCIMLLLTFPNEITSQNNLKIGVNELENFYAVSYTPPLKIEFVFTGNPKYINYFYSDLEKQIKKKFEKKNIVIALRYLNKTKHYESKNKINTDEYMFLLNIDNSITVDEKNGSDRVVKFDLNGRLTSKDSSMVMFSFKTVVFVIHDINNKNEDVANYLLNKILIN